MIDANTATTFLHMAYAIGISLCMGISCGLAGIGQGIAVYGALESMARQPEIAGDLRLNMIIGLAMIESLAIYCLLVALVLLFVKW